MAINIGLLFSLVFKVSALKQRPAAKKRHCQTRFPVTNIEYIGFFGVTSVKKNARMIMAQVTCEIQKYLFDGKNCHVINKLNIQWVLVALTWQRVFYAKPIRKS